MVSVFEYLEYRVFLKQRFLEMPKRGYGQANKLALFLGAHTTLVSQVFKGLKTFTLEQASLVAEFLGLTDLEADYFILLVQCDRAGNESLRKILRRQIEEKKKGSMELSKRLRAEKVITEEKRAIFYSEWTYSAVRQLVAIEGFDSLETIANHFNLSLKKTKQVMQFLLENGLCKESAGRFSVGPSTTHLESGSPWLRVHHMNWRQKALEMLGREEATKLHYTAPMTLSKKDAFRIRELITQFLQGIDDVIEPSPSEELHCLNIDWFQVHR